MEIIRQKRSLNRFGKNTGLALSNRKQTQKMVNINEIETVWVEQKVTKELNKIIL